MRTLLILLISFLHCIVAFFRSREEQAIVELALRQQLSVYAQGQPRPRLSPLDRAFWVALSRLWPRWKDHLVVVRPETVVRWHREGFRRYWRSISTPGPGPAADFGRNEGPDHPNGDRELLAREEDPGRTHEARYPRQPRDGVALRAEDRSRPESAPTLDDLSPQSQGRNLSGMDFFVVPTVRFRLLYVWFAIDHGRRRILHFNVTENPSARWVIQQLREIFPNEPIHRHLIYDNDAIFSPAVANAIKRFEIDPKRTAFRSPWQNGTAERVVGSVRHELLDHVVVLNEDHIRRLLREYVDYYNDERVHTSLQDAPVGRPVESRPSDHAKVVGSPRVGGLHHRYRWREAA